MGAEIPRILVFSTGNISDPGIDLAGASHMDYPESVDVVSVPCSGGISPGWILYAITSGYDGVFVAADGTDCAFVPDCTERTGRVVQEAQKRLTEASIDPRRLKMAAVCSVCSESFVSHIKKFYKVLQDFE